MLKYGFLDDYSEGCHPNILEALADTNKIQQKAYGNDQYSDQARHLIRQHLGSTDVPIHFVAGGTLANILCIASALRPHESVVAASSGHILDWEAGAIEATGHKIIPVASNDGKLTDDDIATVMANSARLPYMSKPRLVYISNATELGTVYTKAELQSLSDACKTHDLLLMLDGARLGVALSTALSDLALGDIAELVDVFWVGGTKAGILFGEAIVIPNSQLATDFSLHIKQRGAMLAKGRLLGIQFRELFSDNLFFSLSLHANAMAQKLSEAIVVAGYHLFAPTESNMVFPVLPNKVIESLRESFDFHGWGKVDEQYSVIRLVTSWATDEAQVDAFIKAL